MGVVQAVHFVQGRAVQCWHQLTDHNTSPLLPVTMLDLLLGSLVVVSSGVSKVPQIREVLSTRIVLGLSLTSILLELYW